MAEHLRVKNDRFYERLFFNYKKKKCNLSRTQSKTLMYHSEYKKEYLSDYGQLKTLQEFKHRYWT